MHTTAASMTACRWGVSSTCTSLLKCSSPLVPSPRCARSALTETPHNLSGTTAPDRQRRPDHAISAFPQVRRVLGVRQVAQTMLAQIDELERPVAHQRARRQRHHDLTPSVTRGRGASQADKSDQRHRVRLPHRTPPSSGTAGSHTPGRSVSKRPGCTGSVVQLDRYIRSLVRNGRSGSGCACVR